MRKLFVAEIIYFNTAEDKKIFEYVLVPAENFADATKSIVEDFGEEYLIYVKLTDISERDGTNTLSISKSLASALIKSYGDEIECVGFESE